MVNIFVNALKIKLNSLSKNSELTLVQTLSDGSIFQIGVKIVYT